VALLKQFLQKLPNPLVPFDVYNSLMNWVKTEQGPSLPAVFLSHSSVS
jgi:hypothetical protein